MAQARAALRPDGLFLAAMLGGDTLQELRIACAVAQQEREGGVSAFVSPLAQVRDAGNLLTRAGLALPTVDVDAFSVGYPSPAHLVAHLRAMAEGSALRARRRRWLGRELPLAAAAVYAGMFPAGGGSGDGSGSGDSSSGDSSSVDSSSSDNDGTGAFGGVAATYQVMFLTGWSPARNQPKAARRGSATASFHDLAAHLEAHGAAAGSAGEGAGGGEEEGGGSGPGQK